MDKLFKIGAAAKALGVSPSTLRRWEREGKITSERTEGDHRLYRLLNLRSPRNYLSENAKRWRMPAFPVKIKNQI